MPLIIRSFKRCTTMNIVRNSSFLHFAGLAIFISCLGLFGLVAFTLQRRVKELGIRNVLGASVEHLVNLVSRNFAILLVIAAF